MDIFCKIVNGEIPCSKVYEDELFIAFLDINPVEKGHTLVATKKHYNNILDCGDIEISQAYKVAKKLSLGVVKALGAHGVNVFQNNGEASGQEVPHFHIHIIPRFSGKTIDIFKDKTSYASINEMAEFAGKIKSAL